MWVLPNGQQILFLPTNKTIWVSGKLSSFTVKKGYMLYSTFPWRLDKLRLYLDPAERFYSLSELMDKFTDYKRKSVSVYGFFVQPSMFIEDPQNYPAFIVLKALLATSNSTDISFIL